MLNPEDISIYKPHYKENENYPTYFFDSFDDN
jgi:hypothetical protein